MNKIIQTLSLMLICAPAFAGIDTVTVSEPGTLALFGLGGAIALAIAIKRKK
jgi:hypothetical protein